VTTLPPSDISAVASGSPAYGFAGDGRLAWAGDTPTAPGSYASAMGDRVWAVTTPAATQRPAQVTGAAYGADFDGPFVSWNQPADADLHVVPVLRDGANNPAPDMWDGVDLEYYSHAGSTHAASLVTGDAEYPAAIGQPVTVSLFTVRVSTQVVSSPVVITWTPRFPSTCIIAASSKNIRYGAGVNVVGTLKSGATALSGRPATLSAKAANGHVATLVNGSTGSSGTLSNLNKPAMNTTYSLVHLADFYAGCSASVTVVVQTALKATLASTRILHGRTTSLTVVVGPNEAGQQVTLQKLSAGKWVNVSTLKLGSTSKARWTVGSKKAGKFTYRVRKLADKYHPLSYSPSVVLTVK